MLKRTPLHDVHVALGGKMIDFGGWELPVQYAGIIEEHQNTRQHVSLFDISHMGEFLVTGERAFDLLQYTCTNDVSLLVPGKAQYSPMCRDDGTVVDDIFYYMYDKTRFKLVVNASNKDKDLAWLRGHAERFPGVTVHDDSPDRGRVALQGPRARDVLERLVDVDLTRMARFQFVETPVAGIPSFVARTGYTGEDGFEISFPREKAVDAWHAIMNAGKPFNIAPAGLGARDTLRLEACYSLYGHELSEEITPIEAGVEFVVKPTKQAGYIGKDVLLAQLVGIVKYKIVALEAVDKGIMRHGQEIFDESGNTPIGHVTSGTYSPTFQKSIALARVDSRYKMIGAIVNVKVRDKLLKARIVHRPFYAYRPRPG